MKSLPDAIADFSAAREGAGILVIQILPAPPDAGVALLCEQASCSGSLAESCSETQVLRSLIATLEATAQHYRDLLRQRGGSL